MEWFSMPFVIKDKETTKHGRYTNFYFVHETEYIDKNGKPKKGEEWQTVSKEIFDAYEVGDKVQLSRLDFFANKKHYDFISECNTSK